MMQEHEAPGAGAPVELKNSTPLDVRRRWRSNKLLAACEIVAVLLIFVADWRHMIWFSKTPFLFVLAWVSLRLRGMRWKSIGLAWFRNWRISLLLGLAAGIGMSLLELLVTQPLLVRFTGKQPDLEGFRQLTGNLWLFLLLVLLSWVQAGIGEEGVYRGYVMNRVADLGNRTRGSWIVSLILVSTLFGFAHTYQGITGVIEAAVAGLLLGLLYLRCGRNLAVPIIAHGLSDTVDFLLIFLGKYPGM